MSRRERTVGKGGPGTTTAADAITVERAEASRDSGRRDDPVPANRPINMNHAGVSSVDDSGVLRQDSRVLDRISVLRAGAPGQLIRQKLLGRWCERS